MVEILFRNAILAGPAPTANDRQLVRAERRIYVQPRRESASRKLARAEPINLSAGTPTAARIFLQSFRGFLPRDLVLRNCARDLDRRTVAQARTRIAKHRRRSCASRSCVSGSRDRYALRDRRPAACYPHV